jgi:hypothetical protein
LPSALRPQHHRQTPRRQIGGDVDLAQRKAPVAAGVDALDGSAPALFAVEVDQAVDQRLATDPLQPGIEGRPDRQTAVDPLVLLAVAGALGPAVEPVLAVHLQELAAHLLGKIVGGVDLRAERADVDLELLGLGRPRLA